jgi:methylated-DNA-[protein]-cysteine S-methyltransferase
MTKINALRDELDKLDLGEAVAGLWSDRALEFEQFETEHRAALRRRMVARYQGEMPIAVGSVGGVVFETDLGFIGLALTSKGVVRLILPRSSQAEVSAALRQTYPDLMPLAPASLPDYGSKLRRYARGEPVTFDNEFDLRPLTAFQQTVLTALLTIPYGEVHTYKEVAHAIDHPKAARAVGNALAKNPIPLMIPCHRIITSDGKLGGYSGGLDTKKRLLALEGVRI